MNSSSCTSRIEGGTLSQPLSRSARRRVKAACAIRPPDAESRASAAVTASLGANNDPSHYLCCFLLSRSRLRRPRANSAGAFEGSSGVRQGGCAGGCAHPCARHRRHRRAAALGPDPRDSRWKNRGNGRRGKSERTGWRAAPGSRRLHSDSGSRRDARPLVLPGAARASRDVSRARQQFSPALSGWRRDVHTHDRQRRALHGPRAEALDRCGQNGWAEDERHRAVSRRRRRVHAAVASAQGRGRRPAHGRVLGRAGHDLVQSLHAHYAGGTCRSRESRPCARYQGDGPSLLHWLPRGGKAWD